MLLSSLRKSENILKFCKNLIFVISLGRVVVPSHKMLINLPGTYEKGEPDRFSGKRDPSVQTDRQIDILLLYYKEISVYLYPNPYIFHTHTLMKSKHKSNLNYILKAF